MANEKEDNGREAQDTRPARQVELQGDEEQAEKRPAGEQGNERALRPRKGERGNDEPGERPGKDADPQADESDIKKKAPTDLPGAMGGGLMGG